MPGSSKESMKQHEISAAQKAKKLQHQAFSPEDHNVSQKDLNIQARDRSNQQAQAVIAKQEGPTNFSQYSYSKTPRPLPSLKSAPEMHAGNTALFSYVGQHATLFSAAYNQLRPQLQMQMQSSMERDITRALSRPDQQLTESQSQYLVSHPQFVQDLSKDEKLSLSQDKAFQAQMVLQYEGLAPQPASQDLINQSDRSTDALNYLNMLYGTTNTDNVLKQGVQNVVLVSQFRHNLVAAQGHGLGPMGPGYSNQMDDLFEHNLDIKEGFQEYQELKQTTKAHFKEESLEDSQAFKKLMKGNQGHRAEVMSELREFIEEKFEDLEEANEDKFERKEEANESMDEIIEDFMENKMEAKLAQQQQRGAGPGQ